MSKSRRCERCRQTFLTTDPNRRFCSRKCQKRAAEVRRRIRTGYYEEFKARFE